MADNRSPKYRGWFWDSINSELEVYVNNTKVVGSTTAALTITPATTVTGALTLSSTASVAGLLTASAALTITTGNLTVTAGDLRVTAANVRLGTVSAFGTTEPTSWLVCRSGTQPAGAITTAGGIGADDTTVQKIIAAGTINNVET